jgi:tRNA(Ile)-lysidine synthase
MGDSMPLSAIASVPAGRWAVAVSGGADSVALLCLLRGRPDVQPHVVHLDHELRGAESDADARFVADLATQFGLPCTIGQRSRVETVMAKRGGLPKNPSARYRAARLALFRTVVAEHALAGVILAHHADDQAETVLHRLIRGSGWAGLCGMRERGTLGGMTVLRPLLAVRREELGNYLANAGQAWREDSSNSGDKYLRNRLRRILAERPDLTDELLRLVENGQRLRKWTISRSPRLESTFTIAQLADLPAIVAERVAARWLVDQGAARGGAISPRSVEMLMEMATDAATPARIVLPGGILAIRRKGRISVIEPPV